MDVYTNQSSIVLYSLNFPDDNTLAWEENQIEEMQLPLKHKALQLEKITYLQNTLY